MRKALAARDRRCVWPGCDRPPEWCDGHHEEWWSTGGLTAVNRMRLLCRRHHRKVHRGYRLVRGPDGRVEVIPPPDLGPTVHAPPVGGPPSA
ncbi:MAG TPA: HNH endonuclease signature motif containing protein [Candidatus Dormibacteraeota bacterium]|nr:HNH endonuclease signature motif containing protein [Candidatus Dormibacteraeota bacterium]